MNLLIKITWTILFLCLVTLVCHATENYKVNATSLKVRSQANINGTVIGRLQKGDLIKVISIQNGWAEIEYNTIKSYVSAEYITKSTPSVSSTSKKETSFWSKNLFNFKLSGIDLPLFHIIIGLALPLLILFQFFKNQIEEYPVLFWITSLLFLALCVTEFFYFSSVSNPTWFCSPNDVGWLMTILDFFIFGAFVYNQVLTFLFLMTQSAAHGGNSCDYRIGYLGWVGGIVAIVVCGIFFEKYLDYVIWGILSTQLIQLLVIVYKTISDNGNLVYMLFTILLYIVGSIATLIVSLSFLALLVIVLVVLLVLSFLGNGSNHCGSCRSYSHGYCHYRNISVSSGDYCNHHRY